VRAVVLKENGRAVLVRKCCENAISLERIASVVFERVAGAVFERVAGVIQLKIYQP